MGVEGESCRYFRNVQGEAEYCEQRTVLQVLVPGPCLLKMSPLCTGAVLPGLLEQLMALSHVCMHVCM